MKYLHKIFETPILIGVNKDEEYINKILELVEQTKKSTSELRLLSDKWNEGKFSDSESEFVEYGYSTFSTQNLIDSKDWSEITKFISNFAYELITDYVKVDMDKFYFNNMWASVYPKNTYVPEHVHPNSWMSGVFYVKADENTGVIKFKDPAYLAKTMVSRLHEHSVLNLKVETGMMVIFPSWLPHETTRNMSDTHKVIVSFNMDTSLQISA